ncbi:MAG: LysR family transcriptional regulator [Firmicutes bacterium]|nr:LysR family transcriptional regulator [Bacillota bacterium]
MEKTILPGRGQKGANPMNTFQLSCFLAVANTLNFARAAEQMHISQPAITHQIKSLETELNVQLFRRTTRLVEITPEGQSFRSDAQSMVAIAAQAKLRFRSPEERPIEKLSIGCSSYNQLLLLPESLKELGSQYPNLHPHLVVVPHEQLYQLLENGTADVIFDIHDGTKADSRLTFRELQKSPIVCVCESSHPLAARESVSMAELKEQSLILCDPINLIPEVAKLQWALAEGKSPGELHFCASVEAAVVLAGAGFGAAVIPEFLVPRSSRLTALRLTDAPELSFGVFYRPYPGDDVLRSFLQIAGRRFSPSDGG